MPFSNTLRAVRLALKSLLLHKLRSGLTMLGIVFGVFSVIAMLAIGEGASAQAQQQVLALGATNIIVVTVKPPADSQASSGGSRGGSRGFSVPQYGLLRADYDLMTNTIPTITGAVRMREIVSEARYLQRILNVRLVGSTTEYAEMNHLPLLRGRFLTDDDETEMANIAVLGAETASTLFPFEDPIGQTIQIRTHRYKVVGVTRSRTASAAIGGSLSGQDFNKDIYIPLSTFRVRIGDVVFTRLSGTFMSEEVQLNQITLKVKDRDDVVPTSEVVRESLRKTHGTKLDYDVIVPLELLRQADQIRQIFNIVLGSIAAISLLVGGIGIMNIMLVSVTERTREIGIRLAIGALEREVLLQFLVEAMVLSTFGGLLGIVLAIAASVALANSLKVPFIFNPGIVAIAFFFSAAVGIVFGYFPARKAARLDPIEALRHE